MNARETYPILVAQAAELRRWHFDVTASEYDAVLDKIDEQAEAIRDLTDANDRLRQAMLDAEELAGRIRLKGMSRR